MSALEISCFLPMYSKSCLVWTTGVQQAYYFASSLLIIMHSNDLDQVRLLPLLGLLLFAKGRHMLAVVAQVANVLWIQDVSEAWVSGSYKW